MIHLFFVEAAVCTQLRQPVIDDIRITGNNQASDAEIIAWLGWSKGSMFEETKIAERCYLVLTGYLHMGYPMARIDSLIYTYTQDSLAVDLALTLSEGPPVHVGNFNIMILDSTVRPIMTTRFATRPEHEFSGTAFFDDMNETLTILENTGYPFSLIEIDSVSLTPREDKPWHLNLTLLADPGPQVHLDEIRVTGNTMTRSYVIVRELRIRPGQLYNQKRIDKIPARLMRLGFFARVDQPVITLGENNRGILLLKVTEGNASKLDGLLGYNPGSGLEPGYFTGLIDLALGNLLGTGRAIEAHWQKRDRTTQELRFGYREPWTFRYPVHTGMAFEQLIQDTTYIKRVWNLNFDLPVAENFSGFLGGSRTTINPDSIGSLMMGIPESRTFSIAFGLDFDTRDDIFNPQIGIKYRTLFEYGQKRNLGSAEVIRQFNLKKSVRNEKWLLDFELNVPLFKYQILSMGLHGKQIKSNETIIPVPDQFRFGGARTLRGYREEQFRGSRIAWSNIEYRYLLGRRSRAFIFFDSGYYWRKETTGTSEAAKIGYGFGLRIETGLGIMSIDYGLGAGDSMANGKIHVGLVNQF